MQVVWEYLVHEENENRCLDKGDTLTTTVMEIAGQEVINSRVDAHKLC